MYDSNIRGQTIACEIFINGNRSLGMSELTLPDLEFLPTDIKGSGVAGVINMPTLGVTSSLEVGIKWLDFDTTVANFIQQRAVDFIAYAASELYDPASGDLKPRQTKIEVRGLPKKVTGGKFVPGETTDTETTLEVIAFKMTVGGEVVHHIDKVNFICVINKVDYLAGVRSCLNI